ncbi:hypothetical protein HPB52_025152 [Rhipicephalus sanguineus]|uniref:Inositol polyphosphate-related phosphatase domain-containing protein n=1 Tax=Rhipicephalus sanguineus TaxID=34632 RepID=A0A9D4TDD6_RHISA|nr:hypothetical protein HPB52_025152 [Rhipicephalus sanguineus]
MQKVKHVRLQGLILTIFTKREHLIQLRGIQSTYTRTGLGVSGYTFWFGDLNFRVDDCTLEEMRASIENNTYSQMLSKDQLNRVRSKGEAFHEFCENDITFAPTYNQRKPAWTDRILYRFTKNAYENVTLDLKQHRYVSHNLYIQSDHKPVFAKPEQPVIYFLPVGTWIINQDSFAWYYTSADTELKQPITTRLCSRQCSPVCSSQWSHWCGLWHSHQLGCRHPKWGLASHQRSPAETENAARSLSWPRNTADEPGDPEPNLEEQRPLRSASAVPATTPPGDSTAEQSRQGSGATKKRGEATVSWRPPSSRQPSPPRASPSDSLAEGASVRADTPPDNGNATPVEGKSYSDQGDDAAEDPGRRPSVVEAAAQACRTDSATGQDGQRQKPPSSERVFYRVLFGDQTLLVSGRYRLVYLRGQSDVLGMSEPFKIKAAVS